MSRLVGLALFAAGAATGAAVTWGLMSSEAPPPPVAAPAVATRAPDGSAPSPNAEAPDAAPPDAEAPDAEPPDAAPPIDAARPAIPADWPELPRRAAPVVPLRRAVELDDGRWLYAARSELTRDQWRRLAGAWPGLDKSDPDRPMVDLTAGHAAWMCNQLSAREGLGACYADCDGHRCRVIPDAIRPCDGYRLPTRGEWQAIARRVDVEAARTASRRLRPGAAVCAAVDALDLCDLYGGVWEWTETARRLRGRKTAFRMGGSWDPGHREHYLEPIQHHMSNAQPFVGLRPVRAADDPRIAIGGLIYDPLSRRIFGGGHHAALDADAAVLFERLIRNGGHLPAGGTSAAIRSGLGTALVGLGGRLTFRGSEVVLVPPPAE